jgi:hypothetical protein
MKEENQGRSVWMRDSVLHAADVLRYAPNMRSGSGASQSPQGVDFKPVPPRHFFMLFFFTMITEICEPSIECHYAK